MGWTDERVELLKKLWADGLSASQIAAELGGITRNAVIGKVHRLGLSGRAKSPSSASPRPRKARPSGHMMRVPRPSMRGNTALAYEYELEPEPELIEIPVEQRKTLLQLTEKTCRWPVGDPGSAEFFFCGGDAVTDMPYCSYHSRVAYQPAADRRRGKRSFRGLILNRSGKAAGRKAPRRSAGAHRGIFSPHRLARALPASTCCAIFQRALCDWGGSSAASRQSADYRPRLRSRRLVLLARQ